MEGDVDAGPEWTDDEMANTWKGLSFEDLVTANRDELARRDGGSVPSARPGSDQGSQSRNWENFYKKNKEKFFKDRHYFGRDYPELRTLLAHDAHCSEWGAGAGNAMWGLLSELPNLSFEAFDCSETAVQLVNSRKDARVRCVIWDPSVESSQSPFAASSLQCSLFVFFLSALREQCTLERVVTECFAATRAGGLVVVRDYGVYDMTMLRFAGKGGRKVAENVYQRHDGTLTHFFSREELDAVFVRAGFTVVRSGYEARELRNRKTKEKMYRNW